MSNPVIKMNTDLLYEGCIIATSRRADTCPPLMEPGIDPIWQATKRDGKWFAVTPVGVNPIEIEITHAEGFFDGIVLNALFEEDKTDSNTFNHFE